MEPEVAIIVLGLDPGANPLCALVGDFGSTAALEASSQEDDHYFGASSPGLTPFAP